jgi:4-aminobutyrate aminotransferase-like enzyme
MGNGHPIAAVVTRREIAQAFQKSIGYFNTFGGNTVSCAVANAVLDVLESEKLQDRALDVGRYLGTGLRRLMDEHEVIGHVHGRGLFYGVDLVSDRQTRAPSRPAARWVRERMKQNGVLIASTGPLGNVLKIRPPLAFTRDDASLCLAVLNEALRSLPRQSR